MFHYNHIRENDKNTFHISHSQQHLSTDKTIGGHFEKPGYETMEYHAIRTAT